MSWFTKQTQFWVNVWLVPWQLCFGSTSDSTRLAEMLPISDNYVTMVTIQWTLNILWSFIIKGLTIDTPKWGVCFKSNLYCIIPVDTWHKNIIMTSKPRYYCVMCPLGLSLLWWMQYHILQGFIYPTTWKARASKIPSPANEFSQISSTLIICLMGFFFIKVGQFKLF